MPKSTDSAMTNAMIHGERLILQRWHPARQSERSNVLRWNSSLDQQVSQYLKRPFSWEPPNLHRCLIRQFVDPRIFAGSLCRCPAGAAVATSTLISSNTFGEQLSSLRLFTEVAIELLQTTIVNVVSFSPSGLSVPMGSLQLIGFGHVLGNSRCRQAGPSSATQFSIVVVGLWSSLIWSIVSYR